MTKFSNEFLKAFNFTMIYEVGPHFDPTDKETIEGLCFTKEQKRKTGYVNDPSDSGGETKFGIAKVHNPNVDIKKMTLAEAMQIYYDHYWSMGHCDKLPFPLNCLMFDATVHHGSKNATKMIQRAFGSDDDGSFGPNTLKSILNSTNLNIDIQDFLNERAGFMQRNVKAVPKNSKYIDGWLKRVESLRSKFIK